MYGANEYPPPQFGVYEWAMTDAWDPSIPLHKALAHEIEFGNGIPEMRPIGKAREALKTVGFEIEHEEDLADRPDEVPWYYPLEGDISKAQTFWDYLTVWRMSWSGKLVSHNAMRLMEFVGLLPKGTYDVGEALKVAGDALVKGGQTKVGSEMYLICAYADDTVIVVHTYVLGRVPETFGLEAVKTPEWALGWAQAFFPIYLPIYISFVFIGYYSGMERYLCENVELDSASAGQVSQLQLGQELSSCSFTAHDGRS